MDEYVDRLRYNGSVCISGLTASGKTTHSHLLAGEFGLTYVSASQIQLNFMGVSPIQTRDFWITEEAKVFWDGNQSQRIDDELLRLEGIGQGYIFDTITMPWRHRHPALCIWLESSLQSRVIKSIVSHRGSSQYPTSEYPERIREKDRAMIELYRKLYSIEIGTDLSNFNLILDITKLIDEPTLNASLHSIATAHAIIRPAVGWYLTGQHEFREKLLEAEERNPKLVLRNTLLDGD